MAASAAELHLNAREEALFDFLRGVVAHSGRQTVMRVAGGWVRDKILGAESDDIDIALDDITGLAFAQLVNARLEELGHETHTLGVIHANPEQSKHLETVAVRVLGFDVDFVNLRSESYAEGSRIPTVEFGSPHADAVRRDLTINALFYNLATRSVEDLSGRGLADLRARVCRTPLAARKTFLDDPLRVLRAVRFATRLGFDAAAEVVDAAREQEVRLALSSKVSRERVTAELDKVLKHAAAPSGSDDQRRSPAAAFRLLRSMGILGAVFVLPDGCAAAVPAAERASEAAGSADPGQAVVSRLALRARADTDGLDDGAVRSEYEQLACACLEALDLALACGPPCSGLASAERAAADADAGGADVLDVRLAWLACAVLPLRRLILPAAPPPGGGGGGGGKKAKPAPLAEATLRTALPGIPLADLSAVARVHAAAEQMCAWCAREGASAEPSRLDLGLCVREAGALWPTALTLATLLPSPRFDAEAALPSGADADAGVLEAARAAWLAGARVPLAEARALRQRVLGLGLGRAHELRPVLTGAELMREAGVPKGPAVGRASRALLELQLSHPGTTREQAIAHITAMFSGGELVAE